MKSVSSHTCFITFHSGSGAVHDVDERDQCDVTMTLPPESDVINRRCFGNATREIKISDLILDTDYVFTVSALNRNSRLIDDVTNTLCSASVTRSAKTVESSKVNVDALPAT